MVRVVKPVPARCTYICKYICKYILYLYLIGIAPLVMDDPSKFTHADHIILQRSNLGFTLSWTLSSILKDRHKALSLQSYKGLQLLHNHTQTLTKQANYCIMHTLEFLFILQKDTYIERYS